MLIYYPILAIHTNDVFITFSRRSCNGELIMDHTKELKGIATGAGADCAGIADLEPFRGKLPSLSQHLIDDHTFAVVRRGPAR